MSTPTVPDPQQWRSGAASGVEPAAGDPGADPRERTGRWAAIKPRVRVIGSALIAALAVLTLAFLGPDGAGSSHSVQRVVIWADDNVNQENTAGAPQQTVVNGWTGNALLDLISKQLDEAAAPDHRPATLLMLAVLLLALSTATAPADRRT